MTVPRLNSLSSLLPILIVCLWKFHGYVLDIMHLLALGVAETPELSI